MYPHDFFVSPANIHRLGEATRNGAVAVATLADRLCHSLTFLLILGAALLALLSLAVYRLYLHPLASHPGPVLARLTSWVDVYHAYRGDKHLHFVELHRRYGPVVRFAPNSVSINDPVALKAIYGHGANAQKSQFYYGFRAAPTAISTLLCVDKTQHARKRRVMAQAFSDTALRGVEGYVQENVREFLDRIRMVVCVSGGIKGAWSAPLDMQKWCNWLVFDIMGDLVFGKSFGTLGERPENREGIHLLNQAAKRNYVVAAMPSLWRTGAEKYLPGFRKLYLDRLKYLAFGKRQVTERTTDPSFGETGRRDIFSYLLHAKDPETGEGFPTSELFMEGNTLIVAGSDTTSTTLGACVYYILDDADSLARLNHEIRSTFASEDEIRHGQKLQSCLWLRACIDESMRMSPAVPSLLPRQVLAGGLTIPEMNLTFPEGVDVGVSSYAIHHHPGYVVDPFTFSPSRWLDDGEVVGPTTRRQDRDALQSIFIPFSMGNRSCLGKPLVYLELGIALARLVWNYDMRLAASQPMSKQIRAELRNGVRREGEYQTQDYFLSKNWGPFVEFRQRS